MKNTSYLLLIFSITLLCLLSCTVKRNETTGTNSNKHISHSGKFNRCSLCASLGEEKQIVDSTIYSVENAELVEQFFVSNNSQEPLLIKTPNPTYFETFKTSVLPKKQYLNKGDSSISKIKKGKDWYNKKLFGFAFAAIIASFILLPVLVVLIALIITATVIFIYNTKNFFQFDEGPKNIWARLGFYMIPLVFLSPIGLLLSIKGAINTARYTKDKMLSIIGIILNGIISLGFSIALYAVSPYLFLTILLLYSIIFFPVMLLIA